MVDPLWLTITTHILVWMMYVSLPLAFSVVTGRAAGEGWRAIFIWAVKWGTGIWAVNQLLSYFDLV